MATSTTNSKTSSKITITTASSSQGAISAQAYVVFSNTRYASSPTKWTTKATMYYKNTSSGTSSCTFRWGLGSTIHATVTAPAGDSSWHSTSWTLSANTYTALSFKLYTTSSTTASASTITKLSAPADITWNISYLSNSGTGEIETQSITNSTTATISSDTFVNQTLDATYNHNFYLGRENNESPYFTTSSHKYLSYAFNNWLGSDGNTYMPSATLTNTTGDDITLTAQWADTTTPVYEKITLPSIPTGYPQTFKQWESGGTIINANTAPTASLEIAGKWQYTITYNGNGADSGSIASQTVDWNISTNSITLSNNGYSKNYHNYWGYDTDADHSYTTSTAYTAGGTYTLGENITLYVIWQPFKYTLTYPNGASSTATVDAYYNVSLPSLSSPYFTSQVYRINKGFSTNGYLLYDASGNAATNPCPLLSSSGSASFTLTDTYEYLTVTFDYNYGINGLTVSYTHDYCSGSKFFMSYPYRPFYKFDGWYQDGSDVNYYSYNGYTFENVGITTNITLKAHWSLQSSSAQTTASTSCCLNEFTGIRVDGSEDKIGFSGTFYTGQTGADYLEFAPAINTEAEFQYERTLGIHFYDENGNEISSFPATWTGIYTKPLDKIGSNNITIHKPYIIIAKKYESGYITGVNNGTDDIYYLTNASWIDNTIYNLSNLSIYINKIPNSSNVINSTLLAQYLDSEVPSLQNNTDDTYSITSSYDIRGYAIRNVIYTQNNTTYTDTIVLYSSDSITPAFFTYDINSTGREMAFGCASEDQSNDINISTIRLRVNGDMYSGKTSSGKVILNYFELGSTCSIDGPTIESLDLDCGNWS